MIKRKRRIKPTEEAKLNVTPSRDKPGLIEKFIDGIKGTVM